MRCSLPAAGGITSTPACLNRPKDNLAGYHHRLSRAFHPGGLVGQVDPPMADENLHAFALRQNLVLTRQIDPIANEMVRVEHVMKGHRADDHNPG
jgi:acyl-[acyl-carrier-protein] desaturase